MPLTWDSDPKEAPVDTGAFLHGPDAPALAHAVLWPYRSMPRRGMARVIGFAFVMILIPVIPLLGSPVVWGLLPFTMGAVWLLWFFLERNYASARLREDLTLWSDRIEIVRQNPSGAHQTWQANPFWVRLNLKDKGGPVEQYLTLSGAGREVELGAFLTPEERVALHRDLDRLLHQLAR